MLSPWFRYSIALFFAGLVCAGLPGSGHATDPEMEFDGHVRVRSSGAKVTVVTPELFAGFQHVCSEEANGYGIYPRVFSFIESVTGNVGPGAFVVTNGGTDPAPVPKVVLRGEGQTVLNGGEVAIGNYSSGEDPVPYYSLFSVRSSHGYTWFPAGYQIELHRDSSDGSWCYLKSDRALAVTGSGLTTVSIADGNVGIGQGAAVQAPDDKLEVGGAIRLYECDEEPDGITATAALWYDRTYDPTFGSLWVKDGQGDAQRLTSHADPREVDPLAQCSFNDPSVSVPFSFHHRNSFIGKGEIIDMAKMAAYVEKKMQAELGDEPGRLVYRYDLPANRTTTVDQAESAMIARQTQLALAAPESMPWTTVELGADGAIPAEAFEEAPETQEVQQMVTVQEKVVDFESGRVVTVERQTLQAVPIPTGRMTKRFKSNWKFEGGVVYRRPTLEEINLADFVKPIQLPQWIVDRAAPANTLARGPVELLNLLRAKVEELSAAAAAKAAGENTGGTQGAGG